MTEAERIQEAIHLLDDVQLHIALDASNVYPDEVFDNLAKATSILEQLYYSYGAQENGETQPLDFN